MENEENDITGKPNEEKKEINLEEALDINDYDVEISEEDFFDELDEGIDSYFQNLRKKK